MSDKKKKTCQFLSMKKTLHLKEDETLDKKGKVIKIKRKLPTGQSFIKKKGDKAKYFKKIKTV